jgi:HEAT repeat protein
MLTAICLALAGCARLRVKQAVKNIGSPDAKVRAAAAETLGNAKAAEGLAPLVTALKDKDLSVRRAAASALGSIGRAEAVEPLLGVAGDKELSETVDAALRQIGAAGEPALLAAIERKPASIPAVRALGAMKSEKAVEPLLALAFDPAEPAAAEAQKALGAIGGARVTQAAMERAKSTDPAARRAAFEMLGALKSRDAVPLLITALEDPDPKTAASAAAALGAIGDDRAVDPLFVRLRAKGKEAGDGREAMGKALGAFGAPVVPRLLETLEDPNEFVRGGAAAGLGVARDERAIAPLVRHLADDNGDNSGLHYTIGAALAGIGAPAFAAVLEAAKSPNEKMRSGALSALGASKDDRAVPAILEMLHDTSADIRHTAGWFVWIKKDPRIDAYLAEAMKKKDLQVIEAAMAYYVSKAVPGSEPVLIEVLNRQRNEEVIDTTIAGLLLNSGNETLEKAARKWAENHGMEVEKEKESNAIHPQWGASPFGR